MFSQSRINYLPFPKATLAIASQKKRGFKSLQEVTLRSFDIILSLAIILLLSPLLIVIMAAIKATSHGPIFFSQWRVKEGGELFLIYKFRTMREGAHLLQKEIQNEQKGGVIFKNKEDPRITSIGRALRRWSLDELPQLWNVLTGDMSLVGPRPHPVEEVANYPHYARQRLATKPGLTGIAQVNGRSTLSFQKTVEYDLEYVKTKSIRVYISTLFRTFKVVISGHGAY